jgi:hypothetical protein
VPDRELGYTSYMRRFVRFAISVLLCAFPTLRADVTMRYKSDVQLASYLPPEILDQFNKAIKTSMSVSSQTIHMKGGKVTSSTGKFSCIVDFEKHELTMVDAANKQVSTVPAEKFNESWTSSIPELPEQARKVFDSMKINFESHKTGRTEAIQGIQAEEREAVLSMEMPMPGGDQGAPVVSMLKMVMQIWTARPEEALRVQAVRELTAYNLWISYFMNPGKAMEKVFMLMPGFGDGMNKMFTELAQNKTVMLRTQMKIYSSLFGQMALSMQKQGQPLPAGYDPDAPLLQVNQEVDELSTAPLEDALFRIPEGYQVMPMADLMKTLTKPKLTP